MLGKVHIDVAEDLAATLRGFKLEAGTKVHEASTAGGSASSSLLERTISTLEIALILPSASSGGVYPGLFLAAGAARFCRTVRNVLHGQLETIGPLEQTTLRIAYAAEDYRPGETSHCEVDPTAIFSVVASLTPFCDFNQSPRNMYQCQMGKQTMATPYHAFPRRVDTKSYRLHTPQSPIVRNQSYDEYALDEYPMGTNAVVAVISYTGYDMEDAMIINKMSYERGFGHGSLYLTVTIDLNDFKRRGEPLTYRFGNLRDTVGPPSPPPGAEATDAPDEEERLFEKKLGADGFPPIGALVNQGEPLCAYVDESTGRHSVKRHKMSEPAFVEEVRLLGSDASDARCEKASIKLRINRNPVPGDKFSSRHGQKGVMSRLWPAQDMPFTESGITPGTLHPAPPRTHRPPACRSFSFTASHPHPTPQNTRRHPLQPPRLPLAHDHRHAPRVDGG